MQIFISQIKLFLKNTAVLVPVNHFVHVGFDTGNNTGVIFLLFPSHYSFFLRPLGGSGKTRRENVIGALLEIYPGRQPAPKGDALKN